ncbi:MAG: putative transcriptional regulator, GntR family protein [Phycisphaerae bacterium]
MPDVDSMADRKRFVARHQIRTALQDMILNGERRPGVKLVQQQLAKRFGVAQGVVREALLELQAYGLVETIDNRGIFVSELSARKLLDSFDVREVHEGLAARLCCDRITRLQIRELTDMVQRIHQLATSDQPMEAASLDREFHHRLVHISGNSMLIRLADNYRLLGKVIQLTREPDAVRNEHLAILKAIEGGRSDETERLMRAHIQTAKLDLERQIARGEFVPRWLAGPVADETSQKHPKGKDSERKGRGRQWSGPLTKNPRSPADSGG